jgi:hypothetical protein
MAIKAPNLPGGFVLRARNMKGNISISVSGAISTK